MKRVPLMRSSILETRGARWTASGAVTTISAPGCWKPNAQPLQMMDAVFPMARPHWSITNVESSRHHGYWKSQARKMPSTLDAIGSSHVNSAMSMPELSIMSATRYISSSLIVAFGLTATTDP